MLSTSNIFTPSASAFVPSSATTTTGLESIKEFKPFTPSDSGLLQALPFTPSGEQTYSSAANSSYGGMNPNAYFVPSNV